MDFPTLMISLLSDDWVFFNDDEIVWDGSHHQLTGIQVNGAQIDGFMAFVNENMNGFDDINEVVQYFIAFMQQMEGDEGLIIPRSKIASDLHAAMREGDLTGITLVNLAACGGAFRIASPEPDAYAIVYDVRLAKGIPCFFDLMARLMWDARLMSASAAGQPFDISFLAARNFDANEYLGDVDEPVAGAQENPTALHVESQPSIVLPE